MSLLFEDGSEMDVKNANEAKEIDVNDELSLIENEIISDFETPEEYLLYYARIGDDIKLRKLFDLVEKENTIININVKGNSKSNRDWSALHLSCYFGHFLVTSLLIEKKANVNITNNDGDTPLHKAAYIGRIDLVTLLLANKADIFIKNENLQLAKHITKNLAVRQLLEEVEESDLKKREMEFLNCAKNSDVARMKELLNNENPVNINCVDEQGDTALHKAAFRNQKDVITFLLQQNNIDTTIKNRRQQIAASLTQNISIKQLLLNVKPNFKNKIRGKLVVNRFESQLMRRNRIGVWRQIYCVLERGIISFYNNRVDGTSGTRRRNYYYLDSAIVEANSNPLGFTIFFNTKSKLQLQVIGTSNNSKELSINRQRWINAIKEHIEYSKNFIRQGFSVDDDSDEDLNDLLPTTYLENLIKNSKAHQAILSRHISGLAQFIDEDLKAMQSELGLESIELSNSLMNLLKRFWPGLTFHLNLIKESASNTLSTLEQCLGLMDKQDKLRQLHLKESQDKIRVLEEIIQALAQQQYDFEKSTSAPYKSPPRKAENDYNLEEMTDCEEYFDAFDEEDDNENSFDKSINEQENDENIKIQEIEEFQMVHDLQQIGTTIKSEMEHRDKLPCKMISRANISLWSILKNCIGKELSKITMPVVFNEPLSFLQRLTENLAYIDLIEKADKSADALERMEFIASYAVACLSNNWLRMKKPFNPLLGETYEYKNNEKEFISVCEQVSHHPPISAYHVEGKSFTRHGSVNPKLKCWGKSIEIVPEGIITLTLKNHNETYSWSNVTCCVHNIIVGSLWFEQYGKMEINCNQSNYKTIIEFKSAGWTGKDLNRLDGFIVNKKTKKNVKFIYGKWTDYLKVANVEDYEQYMKQNDQIFRVPDYHEINQTRNGCQSSNNTSKKLMNKFNNISLKNFTSATIDIDSAKNQKKDKCTAIESNSNMSNQNKLESINLDNNEDEQFSAGIPKSDSSSSLDIPNSRLLWMVEPRPDNSSDYYNFTKFTFSLNELTEDLRKILPPTDSRFRPDIRLLELGDFDAAAEEKNRVEEKQREVRKEMKKNKKTYYPLWFNLTKNNQGKDEWRFNYKYFERDFKNCPDIF